jgi:DNA-directed RNA polymerase subunit M/transcription elongation factor TFIIS
MPLPILETAKHTIEIPSTKEQVEFRPFLVKEEKILLQAQTTEDVNEITKVVKDIIRVCSFEKVNPNDLTIYDMEYIFLQLRAISIGENIEFSIKCEECDKKNIVTIDLTEVKVQFPKKKAENKLQLTDEVGVILRPIRVKDIKSIGDGSDITPGIIASIESIFDEDGVYNTDDSNKKELNTFVESLNHNHLQSIQEYIQNQPKLSHTINFTCQFCGHENEHTIEGLGDFFT